MEVKINKEKTIIAAMFNSIAANYDKLNHILSLGIDKYWRSVLIKEVLKDKPYTALDIACGTGDITIALMKRGVKATGLDIADKMLERAITKSKKSIKRLRHKSGKQYFLPEYICASAHQLPFEKEVFDLE
jgi:demethylmenaquinone methyltransferase/2-methoxy-6-polyprenyl-1,4-benzoquinol methylase